MYIIWYTAVHILLLGTYVYNLKLRKIISMIEMENNELV